MGKAFQVKLIEQKPKNNVGHIVKFTQFGNSVAISGNYAIVGAELGDHKAWEYWYDEGAAYIFERNSDGTWGKRFRGETYRTETKKLVTGDYIGSVADWYFGHSVAISGNYAIVGEYGRDNPNDSGRAYIFERNSDGDWEENVN